MTAPATRPQRRRGTAVDAGRPTDLRLATLHLRVGMLTLARAELESMAGEGTLDDDALLDLGEARWRTGDLSGAGDAAMAFLDTGRESTLAFVIAAEAQAALGRPAEARRLVARALQVGGGALDALFAGMPRASVWPAETAIIVGDAPSAAQAPASTDAPTAGPSPAEGTIWGEASVPVAATPASVGAADANAAAAAAPAPEPVALPDGPTQLEAAKVALDAGDVDAAAVRLALVLRVAPKLAPAVLEAAGSTPSPVLDLVRADAYRLVGREIAARRLFIDAIAALDGEGQVPLPFADPSIDPEET